MKRLLLLIAMAGALSIAGCAWFEKNEVGEHLQRGVSGEGQLGPVNRTPNDQAAEHGVPQTHP